MLNNVPVTYYLKVTYILIFFTLISSGQSSNSYNKAIVPDSIPFTLSESNNIIFPVIINKIDTLNLMLDTGANAVFITKEGLKKTNLNLNSKGLTKGLVSSKAVKESYGNTITIGNTSWENILLSESELSAEHTDGKIGYNLFNNRIISIDYDNLLMIISDNLPLNTETYHKQEFEFKDSYLMVNMSYCFDEKWTQDLFLFDTGFGGSMLINKSKFEKNYDVNHLKVIDSINLKDSNGNLFKSEINEISKVKIGQFKLSNVPNFLSSSGKINVIGSNIIKRFNFILDIKNKHLYLRPNSCSKTKFKNWRQ